MKNRRVLLFLFLGFLNFLSCDLSACIYPYETPIAKYLKSIELTEAGSGLEPIDCIYVINLDERPEKWKRMKQLFDERGLRVNRAAGINGWKLSKEVQQELAGSYPVRMPGGVIGCFLSHVSVLRDAYQRGFNVIWILEDDAEFLEDEKQLPHLLRKLSEIDPDWDVLYTDVDIKNNLGGYVPSVASDFRPDRRHEPLGYYTRRIRIGNDLMGIGQRFGMHSLLISRKGIKKILDYFTHVYFWTAVDIDIHYIPGIRQYSTTRDIISNWTKSPISDTTKETP